jgi:hypothetical protein
MGTPASAPKRILILYYSFSSQTKNLLHAIADGMISQPVDVQQQPVEPLTPQHFPIGSIPKTFWKMMLTFFRQRVPIQPLPESCFHPYDLVILAGPTWSYNPSGPILSLFDRDGDRLFKDQVVIPLISCRGYWRAHWWGLRLLLKKNGAAVPNLIVFSHPCKEPWRTLGVFFKLAGKVPERMGWMQKHYPKYGHTKAQISEARRFGQILAKALVRGDDLGTLDFKTVQALYSKS